MKAPTIRDAAVAWCIRLHEGSLSAIEQEQLDRWLRADLAHAAALDEVLDLWSGVEQVAETPELLSLRRDALDAVHRAEARRWTATARGARWRVIGLAAALVIAVAVGLLLWTARGSSAYRTAVGERRVVVLADGSRLSLDADSAVRVAFTAERRSITLEQGRARFKVAKDPLRPFAVRSGDNVVVATGTEFSVERLAGEVRVALFEGHVAILRDGPRGRAIEAVRSGRRTVEAERALVPGFELQLPVAGGPGSMRPVVTEDGWAGGQLSFADETLRTAAERMNRYASTQTLEIAPELSDLRVSGVFNAGDVDAFAHAIEATFGVKATPRGTTIRVDQRVAPRRANKNENLS